ncbi:MAG: TldD/PmbA family protein, partial [Deltaproteobacteria bacterium]|nr:TldD/PmbA family protein [Deltaproteobacteria bacterium]
MDPISALEKKIKTLSLDDFEIYQIESHDFLAQSNEGKIEFTEESIERGTAIRLFKGGKIGLGCSSDWSFPFLERMVDQAYNGLSIGDEKQKFDLPGPLSALPRWGGWGGESGFAPHFEPKHPALPVQGGRELALVLEREARAYDPRVRRVRDARYSGGQTRVVLKNSRGLEAEYSKSTHEVSLMVMAEDKEEREMAWDSDFSSSLSGIDPVKIGRRVAEKAVSQLGARPIKTQKSAAILDQTVAASFLGVLSSSFLGDQVQKQRSSLRGRLGQTIYSDQVTLVDDGQLENGCLTAPFDGEGAVTRRNELVSHGVLKSFLY